MMKLLIFAFISCSFQALASQMVGGWSPVEDMDSPNFKKIVNFAAEKISTDLGSDFKMAPLEVLSANQQVVAGMKYKFVMRIAVTDCKIKDDDMETCNFSHCGDVHKCRATVWDRPWLNDTQLLESSCEKETHPCSDNEERK